MDEIPIEEIVVDLESTEDGRQRIARLAGGAHPLDILGQVLSEENEKYKAANNGAHLIEWSIHAEPGEKGERPHDVATLYTLDSGERVPLRRFVLVDRTTGKPVQIPVKRPDRQMSMARADRLEHVGNVLDYEATKAEIARRGLEIRGSASWKALEKMKKNAEG